ncbi:hypothetical protein PR048_020562 [Dryococelus australis]|uniref:Uncharacterized protein n=1 Tax=Dryococelus australis TaxID=614101 RepID=A0ABQ9H6N6_9NEOP|nr:hypothetical protein PR048_020562 [Dryococelus australis]
MNFDNGDMYSNKQDNRTNNGMNDSRIEIVANTPFPDNVQAYAPIIRDILVSYNGFLNPFRGRRVYLHIANSDDVIITIYESVHSNNSYCVHIFQVCSTIHHSAPTYRVWSFRHKKKKNRNEVTGKYLRELWSAQVGVGHNTLLTNFCDIPGDILKASSDYLYRGRPLWLTGNSRQWRATIEAEYSQSRSYGAGRILSRKGTGDDIIHKAVSYAGSINNRSRLCLAHTEKSTESAPQCKSRGDPRENPPTSGIVRHDPHTPGTEPGSPVWEASGLTTEQRRRRPWRECGATRRGPIAHLVLPVTADDVTIRLTLVTSRSRIDPPARGATRVIPTTNNTAPRGRSGVVVELLASHPCEPCSIPGGAAPGVWESCRTMPLVGRVFSGVSYPLRPCIPALLRTNHASPLLHLKTSIFARMKLRNIQEVELQQGFRKVCCNRKRDWGMIGKESAMALVWDPSQHSPGAISENHGKPKSGWPDRESNPGPPECESSELPLRHLARVPYRPKKCSNSTWHGLHKWTEDLWRDVKPRCLHSCPKFPGNSRCRILTANGSLYHIP